MLYSASKGLKLFTAIGLLLFSAVSFLPAVPPVAAVNANAIACGSTITVSTKLKADIGPCAGNGLVIGANGIVLNCAGHTISGIPGLNAGITLDGRTNDTVKNCNIAGFQSGFQLTGSPSNILATNNANGNHLYGFSLSSSSKNTLTSNTANGNGLFGFYLFSSSNSNTLNKNTAIGNSNYGYFDDSTGSGTAGTANTYSLDGCSSNILGGSSPTGLCTPQP